MHNKPLFSYWMGECWNFYIFIFWSTTRPNLINKTWIFIPKLGSATLSELQDDRYVWLVERCEIFFENLLNNHVMKWYQIWSKWSLCAPFFLQNCIRWFRQDGCHVWLCNFDLVSRFYLNFQSDIWQIFEWTVRLI